MKKQILQMSSVGLLLACLQATPLYSAENEGKAPVPSRADTADPNSEVYRASDVMNMPVKDQEGNEIGKIKDFVINGETREVLYAVVAMNDGKEQDSVYIMPWTAFQPNYAQQGATIQYTVLAIPRDIWIQAPFYSATQWRTAPFSQWGPRVNNYYSQHITVNKNTRRQTFSANKPATVDQTDKGDSTRQNRNAEPNRKVEPNKNVEPRQSDKAASRSQENPSAKGEQPTEKTGDSKLPAPKAPDPTGPNNSTKPAPKNPAPNPK